MIGIYKITNLVNGKVYVGKSVDIEERWEDHKRESFNRKSKDYNKYLYQSIRKHGLENFSFEVIEECSKEDLNDREIYWIKEYQSFPPDLGKGYNSYPGGEGNYPRLNQDQIIEIFNLLKTTNLTYEEIVSMYHTNTEVIYKINNGKGYYKLDGVLYLVRNNKQFSKFIHRNNGNKNKEKLTYPIPPKQEILIKFHELNYNCQKVADYYKISTMLLKKWCKKYCINSQDKKGLKNLIFVEILGKEIKPKSKYSRNYKIVQIDPETNEVINEFDTRAKALEYLGIKKDYNEFICKSIKNHTLYKGYYWEQINNI